MTVVNVIGIDCSATKRNTGLARAEYRNGELRLLAVQRDNDGRKVAEILLAWLDASGPNLLALDAPLGWPATLGPLLADHKAGTPLIDEANQLFKRHTDREVQKRLEIQPFSIGADRIARTAHSALTTIQRVAERVGPISLAWELADVRAAHVIEVYPSATRKVLGGTEAERRARLLADSHLRAESQHEQDACTCLIAAQEFLNGRAVGPRPDEMALAEREGWIWVS